MIARICRRRGWALATGNFDGLHEQTGLSPFYQGDDSTVAIPDLQRYDVVLAVGLSAAGMGPVAEAYRARRSGGVIIAIDRTPPAYLGPGDIWVPGEAASALALLIRAME